MAKNVLWSYGERIIAQLVTLLVSIILARILLPEEFGAVSLALIFITIANVFVSDGFGNALIQKKESDDVDFSTVFWFSFGLSLVIYAIIYFTAPPICDFYELPDLVPVFRVLGLRIPLASLNSIQRAYVSKRLEFKKFFFSTLIGTVISGVAGVVCAYLGLGVWSIVIQYLSNCFIDSIVLLITTRWIPKFKFSFNRLKPLFKFGWKILLVALLNSIYSNARNIVIGKKFSSEELAFSKKAESFPSIISINISTAIVAVIFPAMSIAQDDKGKVLYMERKSIRLCTFILTPLLIGLAAVAQEVVPIILTDKWIPCVPYLIILCVVYLFQPIQQASVQAMKGLGEARKYLVLEIIKKVFGVGVFLISIFCFNSVTAILLGALIAESFSVIANFPVNKRLLDYKYHQQILDVIITFACAGLMWGAVFGSRYLLTPYIPHQSVVLILLILIGAIVFVGSSLLINRSTVKEFVEMVKKIFSRNKDVPNQEA